MDIEYVAVRKDDVRTLNIHVAASLNIEVRVSLRFQTEIHNITQAHNCSLEEWANHKRE